MGRSFSDKQRPGVDVLTSNPVQYQASVVGYEDDRIVTFRGERCDERAAAIASAWLVLSAWIKGEDRPKS